MTVSTAEVQLRVSCTACTKSYRVGSRLAGRRLRCRKCKSIIEVPRVSESTQEGPPAEADSAEELGSEATVEEGSSANVEEFDLTASRHEDLHASSEVADESRIAVLAELGIDPEAALEAYQRERDRCDGCGEQVANGELEESLAGRLCRECQAEDVNAKPQGEPEEKPREQVALTTREAPDAGTIGLYGALFFVGFAGLSYTLSSLMWQPSMLLSVAVALVIAGFGTHRVRVASH